MNKRIRKKKQKQALLANVQQELDFLKHIMTLINSPEWLVYFDGHEWRTMYVNSSKSGIA